MLPRGTKDVRCATEDCQFPEVKSTESSAFVAANWSNAKFEVSRLLLFKCKWWKQENVAGICISTFGFADKLALFKWDKGKQGLKSNTLRFIGSRVVVRSVKCELTARDKERTVKLSGFQWKNYGASKLASFFFLRGRRSNYGLFRGKNGSFATWRFIKRRNFAENFSLTSTTILFASVLVLCSSPEYSRLLVPHGRFLQMEFWPKGHFEEMRQ